MINQVVAIASAALDGFKNEAKKMVVALVDMERAFVPPQHFIRLVQRRYTVFVFFFQFYFVLLMVVLGLNDPSLEFFCSFKHHGSIFVEFYNFVMFLFLRVCL